MNAGFNVIGHVSANLGLGVVARQVIDLIESRGHPVCAFDVDAGQGRSGHDERYRRVCVPSLDDVRYPVNLFVVALGSVERFLRQCPPSFFDGSRLNVVMCFWELPVLPKAWLRQLERMDVVLGTSDFMTAAFRLGLNHALTVSARLPVLLPPVVPFDRARLGVPADAVLFVCGFEPASDPERKNPHAAIDAFRAGLADRDDAYLVVKVNNARRTDGTLDPVVARLQANCEAHPRIRLLTDAMSYPEVLGLYRSSDVYVALHRAEGLGLAMAEAMGLGRAVVATGWSGNMTFMEQTTACLVGYRLVPVDGSVQAYLDDDLKRVARWADPDVAEAAALMRLLAHHATTRPAVGERAAAAMRVFNDDALRGGFLDALVAIRERQAALADRGFRRERVLPPSPRSGLLRRIARYGFRRLRAVGEAGQRWLDAH